ncbi:Zn(2)-C6 fungal-type domain-containing protein [Mycena chlorophos]|uniref:Zn(2)-C6 fungal-type domain-containing protein n=1 Tax=Mycena chlorophos TaxID=658473 RepID=A0A8H6TKS4_MYCCL|nr:Zn(2)-C6 fungal-type domain-containing protein [Mycena chlorophos]
MYSNQPSSSSSNHPYSTRPPPPGHQRNRIACSNCRRRKIKCPYSEKHPTQPCARCVKDGLECEYVAIYSNEDGQSAAPRWVEPLDPESYARANASGRGAPAMQTPPNFNAAAAYNPADPYQQYYSVPGSGQGFPGSATPGSGSGYSQGAGQGQGQHRGVHYGHYPGPANTVYPWMLEPPTGCICGSPGQCVCGRRSLSG